jgi:hypothetical protein
MLWSAKLAAESADRSADPEQHVLKIISSTRYRQEPAKRGCLQPVGSCVCPGVSDVMCNTLWERTQTACTQQLRQRRSCNFADRSICGKGGAGLVLMTCYTWPLLTFRLGCSCVVFGQTNTIRRCFIMLWRPACEQCGDAVTSHATLPQQVLPYYGRHAQGMARLTTCLMKPIMQPAWHLLNSTKNFRS